MSRAGNIEMPTEARVPSSNEAKAMKEKRAFCVAMFNGFKTSRMETDSVKELIGMVQKSTIAWVNYCTYDFDKEVESVASSFGFSNLLINSLLEEHLSSYEDFETELGLLLPAVRVKELEVEVSRVVMLIKKNLVLTIHGGEVRRFITFRRYAESFIKRIPTKASLVDKLTILLSRLIDESNEVNFDQLRKLEEQGDILSKYLMDPSTPRTTLAPQIYKMKHALIVYLDALWALLDVINSLRHGDAELVTDDSKLLAKVSVLAEDVRSQIGLGEHMSEVLASGLEVLQSIYNNQLQVLNNKLALIVAYLTILGTAVLVPNTLATIFASPAFELTAQDIGWYSVLLIVSTIVSTGLAYWWIKAKGWLPRRLD